MRIIVLCFLMVSVLVRVSQAQQIRGASELNILNQPDLMVQKTLASASSVRVSEIMSYQNGNANQQVVSPQSSSNNIRLIQDGNLNTMDLRMAGEWNNYEFIQQGNRNVLELRNVQANENTLQIVQKGNGNQLTDLGSGLLNRPIRIEQSGGMKIIINGQ